MQTYEQKLDAATAAAMNQLGLSEEMNQDTFDVLRMKIDEVAQHVVTGDEED